MKHCLKQREKNKKKNQCLVTVSDDWYPCIDGDKVMMYWHPDINRIGVWGDDDFGMEKLNTSEAEFKLLKNEVLSKDILKKCGFIQA